MVRKFITIFIFTFLSISIGLGQRSPLTQNYRKFDMKFIHFGFMLGVNTSDFSTQYKPNMLADFDTYSISNKSQPGFQLGIISSMKLGSPLLRLRFIPSLSFTERVLNYTYISDDPTKDFEIIEERIGSTSLDFPLLLKFRTERYNNFAAYIIGGAQYTLDLQSREKSSQKYGDPFIKLFRDDFQAQIGAGVDFFLPFFKFGLEIKLSHGIKNALIQDNTRLSNPVNVLYNRVWWISLTFEG